MIHATRFSRGNALASTFLATALLASVTAPTQAAAIKISFMKTCPVAGKVVMRIRPTYGGYTPQQRVNYVYDHLVPILGLEPLRPRDVTMRKSSDGSQATIYVHNLYLIKVGEPLAQANNTTPGALARLWVKNLQATLPQASVKVRPGATKL